MQIFIKLLNFKVAEGLNKDETEYKSDYSFFAVTRRLTSKLIPVLHISVGTGGWVNCFEQVNLSGSLMSPENIIDILLEI